MNSEKKHKSWLKRKFTLVELLIVMTIMGILAAVLIPSFSGLNKNYTLLKAGQDIGGQVAIARSYAMANHCTMALVFIQKKDLDKLPDYKGKKESSSLINFYNRACRIALVVKNDAGNYEFVMWKPDSNWKILPENTFIAEDDYEFEMSSPLKNVRIGDFIRSYKPLPNENETNITTDTKRYIVFNSDGQLVIDGNTVPPKGAAADENASRVIQIRITEGGYNRVTKNFRVLERSKGKFFYQYVEIDPLTGRTEYSERDE